MRKDDDPFRHHPELRKLVTPVEKSFFRNLDVARIRRMAVERGVPASRFLADEVREADRRKALIEHPGGDLWIFAYGSLMWDPAFRFIELRRAFAPDWERRFILRDTFGGRGNLEMPGVMAALDTGAGCHGLVLRIAADRIESETENIWRRERIGTAYFPAYVATETPHGPVRALTFVADHDSDSIQPDLSWDQQVRYCATGTGFLGTSLDYVANLVEHFATMGIDDPRTTELLEGARAFREANGLKPGA